MKSRLLISLMIISLNLISSTSNTSSSIFTDFLRFTKHYNKIYSNLNEFQSKFNVFAYNLSKYVSFYEKAEDLSPFMDLTVEEFSVLYPSDKLEINIKNQGLTKVIDDVAPLTDIPKEKDWVALGYVAHIKDQQKSKCGFSGAAMAVTAAIESQNAIVNGKLAGRVITLSEQQLIDCSGAVTCTGGVNVEGMLNYILKNDGIESDLVYPYTASDGTCKQAPALNVVKLSKYSTVPYYESKFAEAVANIGPIVVLIENSTLQFYVKGTILNNSNCPKESTSKYVTIVGYGTTSDGVDFWKIRNSWGTQWGDDGYFRITRGNNTCGIENKDGYYVQVKTASG